MVQLHLYCQKDHRCLQLCLQQTSLGDKLKYSMSAESEDSTILQLEVMRIPHPKAFRRAKIGLTGMVTWIFQMTAKKIARHMLNLIYSKSMALTMRNAQSRGMCVPHQMFPDWFDPHTIHRDRLKRCWWRSMQSKPGVIRKWRNSTTECVDASPASLCSLTESFS